MSDLSTTVLYNENTGATTTVPDTPDGYLSGQTLIASGAGWKWSPVAPEPNQGEQPEPVTFVPRVPGALDPETMTVAQLRDELEAQGLSTTGNKAELQDRLRAGVQPESQPEEG